MCFFPVVEKNLLHLQRTDGSRGGSVHVLFLNQSTTTMATAIKILISLLLILHFSRAQKPSDDSFQALLVKLFSMSPQSVISLLLLGLTVLLSGSIYLWVLRYVCIGCCQPIAIGPESEILAGMV